ncbi:MULTISPECIES: hypothetical protein [Flavobacterium]|uniref:Restriction endonuclease type IV Mrr domain-containing protein n=1 Tax=Flavobacterium hankyongi TaxID=1176532 RepID=A0ABP9A951_9FLAO|nr:hypothetical protein [Flavobacterium sp. N1846]
MKNFELFVDEIVGKWRKEKKAILENKGLGSPSNREVGDLAEDYILRKIKVLNPKYISIKSKGSQTPSDIYTVAKRKGYWHIMLIQVKCSVTKGGIYELDENERKVFDELAKFVKSQIGTSEYMTKYKNEPIIISNGYAGVYRNINLTPTKHLLEKKRAYKIFRLNSSKLIIENIKNEVKIAHNL